MTVISLAKANKLRNLLETKVLVEAEADALLAIRGQLDGTETEEDVANELGTRVTAFAKSDAAYAQALTAIESIRTLVAEANGAHGVNAIMAALATLTRKRAYMTRVLGHVAVGGKPADLKKLMARIADAKEVAIKDVYGRRTGINFTIAIPVDELRTTIRGYEADIRKLEEQRNEVNYRVTVTLDELTAQALGSFGLL